MQPEDVNPGFHIYISGSDNTTVKVISDAFQHAEESLIEGPPRGLMNVLHLQPNQVAVVVMGK